MSDLQILYPEPVIVRLQGRSVKVLPVKLRHMEAYGVAAAELIGLLSHATVQQLNTYAARNASSLKRLLRRSTNLKPWQLWFMPATTAIQLAVQVVQANAGFFGEALPAMVDALNGVTSSSNS